MNIFNLLIKIPCRLILPRETLELDSHMNLEDLSCPVCHDLFLEPITLICQHTLCRTCLERTIERRPSCPVCRADTHLSTNNVRDMATNMIINSCIEYLRTECQNEGCTVKILEREKEQHELVCEFVKVNCVHCNQLFLRNQITEHNTVCEFHTCYGNKYGCMEIGSIMDISAHEISCQLAIERREIRNEVRRMFIDKINPLLSSIDVSLINPNEFE